MKDEIGGGKIRKNGEIEKKGEWLDIKEPLDLVDMGEEPVYESLIKEMSRKHGLMTFTNGIREVTFKTPYKDQEKSELTSEGLTLLSSRVVLSEDDYDRGCRKPSNLEDRFYKDTVRLGREYQTGLEESGSNGN
nr:hypothetical protein [Tanacetum cinerariifolium]